ncbi:MAG: ABC transporter permease [Actinomycetota bacterium]
MLHLRQLRRQPVRVVLALISIGAGVALTVAASLLIASIQQSIRELLRATAGPAELRVVGPLTRGGLDAAVTEKVAAVDGVRAVVPMVQAVAIVERTDGEETSLVALGVDCHIEALVGAFGCDEQALRAGQRDGPVLVSSYLSSELGPGARLRTNTGRVELDEATVNDGLDDINGGRVVVFALPTAQRVFDREGRLDVLYIRPESGVAPDALQLRVQDAVGGWNDVLRADELSAIDLNTGPLLSILGLLAVLSIGMSVLLVYNIVSLSLAARRKDLAVAGGIGVAPRTITRGVLAEAGLLGLVGGTLGALIGIPFGAFTVAQASAAVMEQVSGSPLKLYVSVPVLLAGVALGTVTAIVASYVPARRVRRIDVAAEIHGRAARVDESHPHARRRLVLWLAGAAASVLLSYVAAGGGAISHWQPPLGALTLAASAVCVFAAVGALAPLLLRLLLRPLRRRGGPLRVALSNLVANPRRTSVMAVSAAAAVGLASVLAAIGPATRSLVSAGYGEAADGRVFVSTLPANTATSIEGRPSPEVLRKLAAIPGVRSIDSAPCVSMGDAVGFLGVCAHDGGPLSAWETVAGEVSSRAIRRGEAIVGTGAARSRNVRPGEMLRLPTPTGFAEVRVAGIRAHSNFNGYSVYVSGERFEDLYGRVMPPSVLVRPEPGVSPAALARIIESAKLDPDLYALPPDRFAVRLADEIQQQVTPFWSLQRVLLLVALIAALSTLLLIGVQRRRELGVLGAVGFGPGGLARMTIGEASAAALAGGVLSALGSIGLLEAFRNVAQATVGVRPPFHYEIPSAVIAVVLAVFVVSIGGLLPAWRTSRLQIVEAIRDE